MGWEKRSNRTYYYRKVWREGRVHSEYVGGGPVAALLVAVEVYASEQRKMVRQAEREQQALFDAPAELKTYTREIESW